MRFGSEYFRLRPYRLSPDTKQVPLPSGQHDNQAQTEPVEETEVLLTHVIGSNTVRVKRHKAYARGGVEELASQRESGQRSAANAFEDCPGAVKLLPTLFDFAEQLFIR